MRQLKLIFKGKLDFGNERTFKMALELYQNRIENVFRSDVLFSPEEAFDEEQLTYTIPTLTSFSSERAWMSTTSVIREITRFAITGNIQAWALDNGRLVDSPVFEPDTDKTAVQAYRRGRALVQDEGKFVEADQALSQAIEKFKRHAEAYAWRGYVKLRLNDLKGAQKDFSKSIDINPENPDPYYGRAKVAMLHNEWEAALPDLDAALKHSIPWQTVYWRARIKKGECLLHMKHFIEASKEFGMYLRRNFKPDDPSYKRRRRVHFLLGKAFFGMGDFEKALEAFDKADTIKIGIEKTPDFDNLYNRGITKHKAGKKDYRKDIEEAAKQGSKEAADFLEAIA